jgi:hypothetical protein
MTRYKEIVIPSKKDQRNPKRQADFWIDRLGDLKLSRLSPAVLVEVRDELSKGFVTLRITYRWSWASAS